MKPIPFNPVPSAQYQVHPNSFWLNWGNTIMDTEFHELGRIFVPTGIDRHGDSLYVLTNTTVLSGKPETFYRLCGIPLADSGEMMR